MVVTQPTAQAVVFRDTPVVITDSKGQQVCVCLYSLVAGYKVHNFL